VEGRGNGATFEGVPDVCSVGKHIVTALGRGSRLSPRLVAPLFAHDNGHWLAQPHCMVHCTRSGPALGLTVPSRVGHHAVVDVSSYISADDVGDPAEVARLHNACCHVVDMSSLHPPTHPAPSRTTSAIAQARPHTSAHGEPRLTCGAGHCRCRGSSILSAIKCRRSSAPISGYVPGTHHTVHTHSCTLLMYTYHPPRQLSGSGSGRAHTAQPPGVFDAYRSTAQHATDD
jgi:hypothetical protein